jgi:hypothetical protein
MFQIGPSLREARTRRGLSPADVHKAIRIRERYLTALEEERWEMLPGDAYTKGFLRTYAEFLGLDGQLYVEEYATRVARVDDERLVPESLHVRRSHGRAILVAVAALVVGVGAAAAALVSFGGHGSSGPQAIVPPAAAAVGKRTHARAQAKVAAAPEPSFALIRATRDLSWLSVHVGGPSGRTIFEGTLYQGHALRLGLAHPLWVRMGRPYALDVTIGTRAVGGLPAAPTDILLTRDGVRR